MELYLEKGLAVAGIIFLMWLGSRALCKKLDKWEFPQEDSPPLHVNPKNGAVLMGDPGPEETYWKPMFEKGVWTIPSSPYKASNPLKANVVAIQQEDGSYNMEIDLDGEKFKFNGDGAVVRRFIDRAISGNSQIISGSPKWGEPGLSRVLDRDK